jgi:glycine oxidase
VAPPSDIVVIGAGIVGCAVAYELARRGASVEIVDDRPAGMGATQAAAGVLAPFIEAREGGPLLELTARSLELFDAFVPRVVADSGVSVTYQRTGTVDVALHDDSYAQLAATRNILTARGVTAHLLDAPGVRSYEPNVTGAAVGGLLIPTHGFVSASDLTRALVGAARKHGAQIIEHGRARRIVQKSGELVVETERGSLSGDAVVLAAGSWSGQIQIDGAKSPVPVRPIRGQLLQLGWTGTPLGRVVWGERCYAVPWPGGTVFAGATVEDVGFDERTTVTGVQGLIEAVCELLPDARRASFATPRVGLRPGTPDQLPIIGASSMLPGLMYATGHYRNGVLLAPLTARLVADAMLHGVHDPMLTFTKPSRFGL